MVRIEKVGVRPALAAEDIAEITLLDGWWRREGCVEGCISFLMKMVLTGKPICNWHKHTVTWEF